MGSPLLLILEMVQAGPLNGNHTGSNRVIWVTNFSKELTIGGNFDSSQDFTT